MEEVILITEGIQTMEEIIQSKVILLKDIMVTDIMAATMGTTATMVIMEMDGMEDVGITEVEYGIRIHTTMLILLILMLIL